VATAAWSQGSVVGGCIAAAVAGGVLASSSSAVAAIAVIVAVVSAVAAIRRWGVGVWYGILMLGIVDGLPGKNLEQTFVLGSGATNVLIYALIVSLLWDNARSGLWRLHAHRWRWASRWAAAYVALCVIATARVYVSQGESRQTLTVIGMGYLAFGLLVPLFAANLSDPRRRNALLATCGVGAVWVALTTGAAAATGASLSAFVHITNQAYAEAGLTRIYATAINIVVAALPFGLGLALFGRTRWVRVSGGIVFGACAIGVGLSLVRVFYLAEIVGLGLALLVWGVWGGTSAAGLRTKLVRATAVLAVAGVFLGVADQAALSNSPLGGVLARAGETFGPAQQAENQIRLGEAHTLEHILGGEWLLGLGFQSAYYPGLPTWDGGSIKDGDVGVLNAVMGIGVLGAAVTYLPFLLLGGGLARYRIARREADDDSALAFAVFAFLAVAVVSSVTLTLMFYATGTPVCAAVIGIGLGLRARSSPTGSDKKAALAVGPAAVVRNSLWPGRASSETHL
jgi:hypothetical protein